MCFCLIKKFKLFTICLRQALKFVEMNLSDNNLELEELDFKI